MIKNMYEKWMEDRILIETKQKELSLEVLKLYQLNEIRKTINTAKKSKFYKEVLKDIQSEDVKDFEDFS